MTKPNTEVNAVRTPSTNPPELMTGAGSGGVDMGRSSHGRAPRARRAAHMHAARKAKAGHRPGLAKSDADYPLKP